MEDTRSRWDRAFNEALEFDVWGQVEEAVDGYQKLQSATAAEYAENVMGLGMQGRQSIGQLAAALSARIKELKTGKDAGVGLASMKLMKPYMKKIIITDAPFPSQIAVKASDLGVINEQNKAADLDTLNAVALPPDGSLRPPPQGLRAGDRCLVVHLEEWGMKDAASFEEPRIAVSVRDATGDLIEAVQETPSSSQLAGSSWSFGNTLIHIQTPLNRIPKGSALFFEFRHWKKAKNKKSCKAYCWVPVDGMQEGSKTLEAYKKPADYQRKKKPTLLTTKPLYLHLRLTINTQA